MHLVKNTTGACHVVEYFFNHREWYCAFGDEFEHFSGRHHLSAKLSKLLRQQIHERYTGLSELAEFLATKHGCGTDLAVSEHEPTHIHTKAGRNIGQAHRDIKQLVGFYTICGQLFRKGYQVFNLERGLNCRSLNLTKQLIRPGGVLYNAAQCDPLHFKLGSCLADVVD